MAEKTCPKIYSNISIKHLVFFFYIIRRSWNQHSLLLFISFLLNFFKKYFFPRVCELLQSGAVMNKSYQPHEGHIPYLLQLFMDYNLYGMNLINMAAVKFRRSQKKGKLSCRDLSVFSQCLLCPAGVSDTSLDLHLYIKFYSVFTQTL